LCKIIFISCNNYKRYSCGPHRGPKVDFRDEPMIYEGSEDTALTKFTAATVPD